MRCRICENTEDNISYTVQERMFGTSQVLSYFQCARCKCLQIAEIPVDMSRYYPQAYYSFSSRNKTLENYRNPIKRYWKISRAFYTIFPRGLISAMMRYPSPQNRFAVLSRIVLR